MKKRAISGHLRTVEASLSDYRDSKSRSWDWPYLMTAAPGVYRRAGAQRDPLGLLFSPPRRSHGYRIKITCRYRLQDKPLLSKNIDVALERNKMNVGKDNWEVDSETNRR